MFVRQLCRLMAGRGVPSATNETLHGALLKVWKHLAADCDRQFCQTLSLVSNV